MKTLILLISFACALGASLTASAQAHSYNVQAKTAAGVNNDTLTDSDTSYATVLDAEDHIQAFRAVVTKVDGNSSSVRIYLQARIGAASAAYSDGNWDTLDSLVCLNQTTNIKQFNVRTTSGNLLYKDYRLFGKGAGTTNAIFKAYQVRRKD